MLTLWLVPISTSLMSLTVAYNVFELLTILIVALALSYSRGICSSLWVMFMAYGHDPCSP